MNGRIKNDGDWYLASICMRNEPVGRKSTSSSTRQLTWVNTHLIHAKNLSTAYDKAEQIGKSGEGPDLCRQGRRWRYVGLWDIVPIYDDLADGEELYWTDFGRVSNQTAKSRCVSKRMAINHFNNAKK